MFIDTSVFVAIFAHEDDREHWLETIDATDGLLTSSLVVLESTMRLTSLLKLPPPLIREKLEAFFIDANIRIIPIEAEHATVAVEAFARFGKGRGHPAQLNLADCLSYACAKSRGVPLLYKGNDFARTDLK